MTSIILFRREDRVNYFEELSVDSRTCRFRSQIRKYRTDLTQKRTAEKTLEDRAQLSVANRGDKTAMT